jgi:HD-GYP domain-containing protein (c-di-GMP phosphodiesterase class II)
MRVVQTRIKTTDYYTLLDLDNFAVGDTIPFDIFIKKSSDYIIIIEAGTILSQKLYDKLEKQESLYIFKKDKDKLSLTCENLKDYIKYNKDNIEKRFKFIYDLNTKLFDDYMQNKENMIDSKCVNLIVESIIYLIQHDKKFIKNTIPLFINENNIANHSLHVAIYAVNLGNLLKLNDSNLLRLGISGLLIDLGLKKINPLLINKADQLTPAELKEIQKHSRYSVYVVKQNNIHDPYIIDAIMHHHEQYDGSGYPEKLKEEDISIFASVLSICDVFDALTSDRPHRKQYSSFEAIKMMIKDASMANKFNHKYLQLLLKSL